MSRVFALVLLSACAPDAPVAPPASDPSSTPEPVPTETIDPDCAEGSVRGSGETCGLSGELEEACVDGAWRLTDVCDDRHPEDDELLLQAEGDGLSFQCAGTPLDPEAIVRRMPVGGDTWTPSASQNSGWTEHYFERYFRTCSSLTGCSDWRTSLLDPGAFWLVGFRLDEAHRLNFVQEESEDAAGTPDAVLTPIDSGRALVTMGIEWGFTDPERFLVQASDGCFSMSTLVHRTEDTGDSWTEEVYGLATTWDWALPPRPTRPPAPTLPEESCAQVPTNATELANAWFAPGSTYAPLGSPYWPRQNERWCTDRTGCTGWSFVESLTYVNLYAESGLELEISGERVAIESDGTFASEEFSGFVTPDCMRIERHYDQTFDGRAARRELRATMVIDAP